MSSIVVSPRHVGPPAMGHGGYVAGLLARRIRGAAQVTLRRPTPIDVELDLVDAGDGRWELRHGDDLLAEAMPAELEIEVPPVPSVEQARAAEAGSPSHWDEQGVHPICFGCGLARDDDDGLAITVGPLDVDGHEEVAGVWRPRTAHAGDGGAVDPLWVLAALDCPGSMAFIARGERAGLLGRIVFEQYAPAQPEIDHVVTGWQIGRDDKRMYAGTALATADGAVLAAARATWFGWPDA